MERLQKLTLEGLKELNTIPEALEKLSSLTEFQIENCKIESLPMGLAELSLLKSISLLSLNNLQLHQKDVAVFSKLRHLTIRWCSKVFTPTFAEAFWVMIKSTTSIRSLELDWFDQYQNREKKMFDALEENGSIVEGGFTSCRRNKSNHKEALQSVLHLLTISRRRYAFDIIPKDVFRMIAIMLWNTRCDVKSWGVVRKDQHAK